MIYSDQIIRINVWYIYCSHSWYIPINIWRVVNTKIIKSKRLDEKTFLTLIVRGFLMQLEFLVVIRITDIKRKANTEVRANLTLIALLFWPHNGNLAPSLGGHILPAPSIEYQCLQTNFFWEYQPSEKCPLHY